MRSVSARCLAIIAAALVLSLPAHPVAAVDPADSGGPQTASTDEPSESGGEQANLTESFSVVVSRSLRSSSRTEHFASVTLKNTSDSEIGGPIALVVTSTGLDGLTLAEPDGTLDTGEPFIEFIPEKGSIRSGRRAGPKKVEFVSEEPLAAGQRSQLALSYQVVRVGDEGEKKVAKADDEDEENIPGKKYSWEDLDRVFAIQQRNEKKLFAHEAVVGVGTGEDADGNLQIVTFTTRLGVQREIPREVEGVPVTTMVSGVFRAGPGTDRVLVVDGKKKALGPPRVRNRPAAEGEAIPELPDSPVNGPDEGESEAPGEETDADESDEVVEAPGSGGAEEPKPGDEEPIAEEGSVTPTAGPGGDPTIRFDRPVPIGVSSFNIDEPVCATGTLGCRCVDSNGTLFALSNNHVWAAENAANIGDRIAQPGPLDAGCTVDLSGDVIGNLVDFEPIDFSNPNSMDAALMAITPGTVGADTPDDGYGFAQNIVTRALPGTDVQKYGRTTVFTQGTIAAVNVTSFVGYTSGVAQFDGQIAVTATTGSLGAPGDSGSLVVTDPDRRPVGLLFAGGGGVTLMNPIGPVLQRFNVAIDDGSGVAPPARPARVGFAVPGADN